MLIKPKAGQAAKIKVVGVGGGGGNAINSMIKEGGIEGVEFVAVNTDAQALLHNKADIKVQIGDQLTKGLGSGGNPEVGRQAAEESREKLKDEFGNADMIFITCGEGGGTGTGASPIVAEVARESGALTVAVVTKPFDFEGAPRKATAAEGIDLLKDNVDTLIVIPNQRVLQVIDKKTSILEAFKKIDSVLYQGVKGIAELITLPGLINVDFADVRTIMSDAGSALMGIGFASGDDRAIDAAKTAISSPLLEVSIDGARGVLFNVSGGADLAMAEINEAAKIITDKIDPDAKVIFGAVQDDKLKKGEIKITVIATGFTNGAHKVEKPQPVAVSTMFDDTPSIGNGELKHKEEYRSSEPKEIIDGTLDDTEFDIPAFIRRKMK